MAASKDFWETEMKAIEEMVAGDTIVAETEIHKTPNNESDRQIIDLVKSLSSAELKKIGLRRLEKNLETDCWCRLCAHHPPNPGH
jgi:hypothetical protein